MFLSALNLRFFLLSLLLFIGSTQAETQGDSRVYEALSSSKVVSELIQTLSQLQVAETYELAYESVVLLDLAMKNIIGQGSAKVGEDYFRAHLLRAGLEIILVEKNLDLEGCFRVRLGFHVDFALRPENGEEVTLEELPSMVKEAYAILNKLCELY